MSPAGFEYDRFCDDLGPEKIVHLYEPATDLRAILVVDNTALGVSIGGVRMAADVGTEEVLRLARAMTLKNAAAGLAHGGGKAGILADPGTAEKEALIRVFARAIAEMTGYVPGPDMGTDESCMAWVHDEIGRAVGLPAELGGIPLDEVGATGWGLAASAEVAKDFCGVELDGATMAIEGFGSVGRAAARFLGEKGVRLVAASDSKGAVHDPDGLDVEELLAAKEASGSVTGYAGGRDITREELFSVPCDILVPAARPDSIRADNVDAIEARLVLEGANIPATAEAETRLHERGVLVVPDFIANAGGVICAAVEYHGGTQEEAFRQIREKISGNVREVLEASRAQRVEPRAAAVAIARKRVESAMVAQSRA